MHSCSGAMPTSRRPTCRRSPATTSPQPRSPCSSRARSSTRSSCARQRGARPGASCSTASSRWCRGPRPPSCSSSPLGDTATDVYADCVRLGRLGWAALACGTGRAVLDYVIPYVNDRKAFGEPISHRQAVAFMVANIGIELEGARLVTLRAAARAEQGRSYARETALARRLTTEYGMQIGSNGVQLLGGHGYVKEHPVERWYRDLRAVGVMEGVVLP